LLPFPIAGQHILCYSTVQVAMQALELSSGYYPHCLSR